MKEILTFFDDDEYSSYELCALFGPHESPHALLDTLRATAAARRHSQLTKSQTSADCVRDARQAVMGTLQEFCARHALAPSVLAALHEQGLTEMEMVLDFGASDWEEFGVKLRGKQWLIEKDLTERKQKLEHL